MYVRVHLLVVRLRFHMSSTCPGRLIWFIIGLFTTHDGRARIDVYGHLTMHATAYVYACNGQYGVGYVPAVLFNGLRYSTTLERSYCSSHRPHTDMLVSQLDSTKYKNIIMSQALTVIHANMHIKETCTIPLPERKGLYVYIYLTCMYIIEWLKAVNLRAIKTIIMHV